MAVWPTCVSRARDAAQIEWQMRNGTFACKTEFEDDRVTNPAQPHGGVQESCRMNSLSVIQGRPVEAAARARRALVFLDRADAPSPLEAAAYDVLGTAASMEGRTTDAVAEHQRGLDLALARFGEGSPNESVARAHLAESLALAGRWDDAARELAESQRVTIKVFGTDGEAYGATLATESMLAMYRGDAPAARKAAERALELLPEGEVVSTARTRLRLARALWALSEFEAAIGAATAGRTAMSALPIKAATAPFDAWLAAHPQRGVDRP